MVLSELLEVRLAMGGEGIQIRRRVAALLSKVLILGLLQEGGLEDGRIVVVSVHLKSAAAVSLEWRFQV